MAVTSYASLQDLVTYGVGPDALDDFSEPERSAAIEGASRLIDSYLRSRFTLPLLTVGADLNRACAIIACYDLLSARGWNPSADGAAENFRLRYEDTLRWLQRIADGKVAPDVTDSSSGGAAGSSSAGRPRVVSAAQRGWSSRGSTDNSGGGGFTSD